MKKTKKRSMPVMTIPTLLTLSVAGSRLIICGEECYVLTRRTPKYVSTKIYDALLNAGWISSPEARGADIAECLITAEGKSFAEKVKAQRNKYCQLLLL